ncbi:DUF3565 domain-containing protein [Variovorax sp. J22P240]|uniref:DUF3565 domain-containing protein n=1 Tax=Variovorax sp. J22P240 TaxID=3053514 RepID=UPI0033654113
MQRSIVDFVQDEVFDWVALLDCGHRQHVRHNPPLVFRPWVLSEEGRTSQIGAHLQCLRCERFELPEHYKPYRASPVFTEDSVPAALRKDHSTRGSVWGRIHVLEGRLRYVVDIWSTDVTLTPEAPGIVVPDVLHRVEPMGPVRFFVEFYAALDT